jgi:hypothetical protein
LELCDDGACGCGEVGFNPRRLGLERVGFFAVVKKVGGGVVNRGWGCGEQQSGGWRRAAHSNARAGCQTWRRSPARRGGSENNRRRARGGAAGRPQRRRRRRRLGRPGRRPAGRGVISLPPRGGLGGGGEGERGGVG